MSDKITACLWFDTQGEEAANFYTSVVPNSKINEVSRYPENGPGEPGEQSSRPVDEEFHAAF